MAELHLPHRERTRHTHLVGTIYATATGFKIGARGRVHPPGFFLGTLSKGHARIVRRAAYRAGFYEHAAAPRIPETDTALERLVPGAAEDEYGAAYTLLLGLPGAEG